MGDDPRQMSYVETRRIMQTALAMMPTTQLASDPENQTHNPFH
jgi:hypothetical protein